MDQNNDDIFLSLVSSGAASGLLLWQGWTVTGFVLFTVFMYFLSKLRGTEKIRTPENFQVVVIGAGVSGICIGKRLKDAGINFTILEKSATLGGTWYDNRYPGVACDVPSHLYSFSFFMNPSWSRAYSHGKEIHNYLQTATSKFGIYPNIKCGKKVTSSTWDQDKGVWKIECEDGDSYNANVVIYGSGALHKPRLPDYKGMEKFKGPAFHTAQYQKGFDPAGKKIGLIGTGASAVQAVPNLAEMGVKSLEVFQRTPCWSPPRLDYKYPESVKTMLKLLPFTNTILRWFYFWRGEIRFRMIFQQESWIQAKLSKYVHGMVKHHYRNVVKDPELCAKLTPSYDMGCKRITPSDTYLQAFNKENVHLTTDKIEEITETGIRTVDGKNHEVDAIIYATGFDILGSANPFKTIGRNGADVVKSFGDTPMALYGITHYDVPNAFWLLGPGTGLGHNSIIYMIECQAEYAMDGIRNLVNSGAKSMVVKKEVVMNYWDWMQENLKGKVFSSQQVASWYKNDRGVNWTLWPLDLVSYWWYTKTVKMEDYNLSY